VSGPLGSPARRAGTRLATLAAGLALAACASGPRLAPSPKGSRLVVATRADSRLAVIDPTDGALEARLETGPLPAALAIGPEGRLAVVADGGNAEQPGSTLTVFDLPRGERVRTIDLAPHGPPGRLAFTGRGAALLVALATEDLLLEVDASDGRVLRELPAGGDGPVDVAVTPDGALAFVANEGDRTLGVVALDTGTVLDRLALGEAPTSVAIAPDGSEVWVSVPARRHIARFAARSLERLPAITVVDPPLRLAFVANGRWVVASYPTLGEVGVLGAHTHQQLVRLATAAGANRAARWPTEIAVDDRSKYAFVIDYRAMRLTVIDVEGLKLAGSIPTGPQPIAVGWSRYRPRMTTTEDRRHEQR
jgi:DNA-binding beta-propeller fold protein YncE